MRYIRLCIISLLATLPLAVHASPQRRVILICRFFTRLYRPSLKDVLWLCVIFACVLSPC